MNELNQLLSVLEAQSKQLQAAQALQERTEARALYLRIYCAAYDAGKEREECDTEATLAVLDFEKWLTRFTPQKPVDVDGIIRAMEGK